jgi:hypothetical protein
MTTISAGDFLKTRVKTPLKGQYWAAGVRLRITTNFEPILVAARKFFEERMPPGRDGKEEIRLRFWVEDKPLLEGTRPKPYFRGLNQLVFAGFDGRNSFLLNLQDRCGIGRFTPEMASDAALWETIVFPTLLTIFGPSVGLTPLHCACVAWKGSGLLLAGESGAGKSTLSLALVQAGFDFLSDDRTLIGKHQGRLLAWGLSKEMKLRVESKGQFQCLGRIKSNDMFKREDELRFDASQVAALRHVRCCEPRWLVFLEQQSRPGFSLTRMAAQEAAERLESQLHREAREVEEKQHRTMRDLVTGKCYRLRYGGDPHTVAGALHSLVVNGWKTEKPMPRDSMRKLFQPAVRSGDPLRRFRATPFRCEAHLMGRRIYLETNNPIIVKHARRFLNCIECNNGTASEFRWKIVTEPGPGDEPVATWPPMTAFTGNSMRYINLGQRGFIAVDHAVRQAIGMIPEHLANDEAGFSSVYLASMFYLTAPALGLVAISAACVAMEGRGLLLFGVPGSGKTTASYRSSRLGLEFHADQAVFLENKGRTLHAWGDFWPAAFREDGAKFLPELAYQSRPLAYCHETFLCVEKSASTPASTRSVTPVGCIFLERQAEASPKLVPLRRDEVHGQIAASVPFLENFSGGPERDSVFESVGRLPVYMLAYGRDPSEAAPFLRSMLRTHHPVEDAS